VVAPGIKWNDETTRLVAELRTAWLASGMTTYELAIRAGTSQSTVSAVLCGRHQPLGYTLVRFADALGLRLALLPKSDLDTLPTHEETVAADESNPTGKLAGVDGVGIGDVPGDPPGERGDGGIDRGAYVR
jgi:transcriptional regulator with XRE-family HTH domain